MSRLLVSNSAVRPAADDQGQVVVGRPRCERPGRAEVDLEAAVHRQPAPVGVVGALQPRLLVVLLGPHRAGDQRVQPVGPDDHPGPLGDGGPALGAAADAGHPPVVDEQVGDGEPLPHLGARLGRGVEEDLVQHGPPRAVGDRGVGGPGGAGEGERAEVEGVGVDRWAPGRDDPVEQPPAPQRGHPRGVHEVGGHGVAGERGPVHDQHAVTRRGQQHRDRGARAARAHHDDVVSVLAHVRLLVRR